MWKLFRIFYNALFTILSIVLFLLTVVTPLDIIIQSLRNKRLGNIFAIASVYIVTLVLAFLIYLTRLYTNRSVLGGIPRPWVPVEKPDVPKSVRRLVVEGLTRSAVIAQQARPRDRTDEDNDGLDPRLVIPADAKPPWGDISHAGWTAPECPDLPDQEFETVIKELPHLLEAKAVSLAPPDPRLIHFAGPSRGTAENIPDERIVDILQRPRSMCLRGYLNHLARLDMIHDPKIATSFISLFERARYSEQPLTESEFRALTGLFAELLRGMREVDPAIVADVQSETSLGSSESSDTRSGRFLGDNASFSTSDTASFMSTHTTSVRQRSRHHPLGRTASDSSNSFRVTDVGDQRSLRSATSHRSLRTPSMRSLRPMRSNLTGSSEQSVIRRTVTYS